MNREFYGSLLLGENMKIKKLLPVYASSYYEVLMKELNKDFKKYRKDKSQSLKVGTTYDKYFVLSNGKVKYKVTIQNLEENKYYQVQMNFPSYSQIISHQINQIDSDGVIRVTYVEKVINCSFFMKCLFSIKGRFTRMKVMQFIHYLYKEAQQLEEINK